MAASWITSQYDTYAPAASIASQSFQKSFPPNKLKEVFQYCQNEILDYIIKNLTQHTPQTICNPKYVLNYFIPILCNIIIMYFYSH